MVYLDAIPPHHKWLGLPCSNPVIEKLTNDDGDEESIIMIFDHKALMNKKEKRALRMYILDEDEVTVHPVDLKAVIDLIVKEIENDIDVSELLAEAMKTTPPDVLMRTYHRIKTGSVIVDAGSDPIRHCCYSALIKTPGLEDLEIVITGGARTA